MNLSRVHWIMTAVYPLILTLAVGTAIAQDQDLKSKKAIGGKAERKQKVDESKEPPLKFVLDVDGKKIEGQVGQMFSINGSFDQAKAVLKIAEHRTFNYSGIEFKYPARHAWKSELIDPQSKAWTMSGAESSISVFVVSEKYTADDYAKELVEQFNTDDFDQVDDLVWNFGGKEYKGTRLIIDFDGFDYVYDIVTLPEKNGDSRLILLEDCDPQRKPESEEVKFTMELLKKTFKLRN